MIRHGLISIAGLLAMLGGVPCDASEPPLPLPAIGETVSLELSEGTTLAYGVTLEVGDVLRIRADQEHMDVALRIVDPDGNHRDFDSGNAFNGPEWLIVEADISGSYGVEILANDAAIQGEVGWIRLAVEGRGEAGPGDRELLRVFRALDSINDDNARAVAELQDLWQTGEEVLPGLVRARVAYQLGKIHRYAGRFAEAVTFLKSADEGFGRFGNAWEQTPALSHLAFVLLQSGHFDTAEDVLKRADVLSKSTRQPRTRASIWTFWGILHSTQGRHSRALQAHRRAEQLFEQIKYAKGLADCRHNIGSQLLVLGELEEGQQMLWEAADRWRELNRPLDLGRTLLTLSWGTELQAELTDNPEDLEDALNLSHQAVDLFSITDARWELAVALEHRGSQYFQLDQPERALEDLQRSSGLVDPQLDRMHLSWVSLGLGPVLRRLGRSDDARQHLEQALRGFEDFGHHGGRVAALLELARWDRSAGRREDAAVRLNLAIHVLEGAREELRTEEFRRSFLSLHQDIYEELIDLWAGASWKAASVSPAQARRWAEKAVETSERGRARGLLDRLAAARRRWEDSEPSEELLQVLTALEARAVLPATTLPGIPLSGPTPGRSTDRSTEPDSDSVKRARIEWRQAREADLSSRTALSVAQPLSMRAIYALVDEGTTLLLYALGSRRSWVFQISSETVQVHMLPSRRKIEAAARRVHSLLPRWDTRGSKVAARATLPDLAALVVAPLETLPTDERWVVVPSGALNGVPFSALPGPDGQILVATRNIVYLPSISVLGQLRTRRDKSSNTERLTMAVIADPVFGPDDPRISTPGHPAASGLVERYLSRLPATLDEANYIMESLASLKAGPVMTLYEGFGAEADLFRNGVLEQVSYLHIATHGFVDPRDPAIAGLVFSLFDSAGQPRNGFLPVRDLYRTSLDADLVVLSACRTGAGQTIRGEGLVGLSHGFFAAGARRLVVSLWDVEDQAAAELMKRFYFHLFTKRLEPDRALRLAQNEMRLHPLWSSPRHWAGFVAWGDW